MEMRSIRELRLHFCLRHRDCVDGNCQSLTLRSARVYKEIIAQIARTSDAGRLMS